MNLIALNNNAILRKTNPMKTNRGLSAKRVVMYAATIPIKAAIIICNSSAVCCRTPYSIYIAAIPSASNAMFSEHKPMKAATSRDKAKMFNSGKMKALTKITQKASPKKARANSWLILYLGSLAIAMMPVIMKNFLKMNILNGVKQNQFYVCHY